MPRVFITVDNRPDRRGQAAINRLRNAHPNAIMIHIPTAAPASSWRSDATSAAGTHTTAPPQLRAHADLTAEGLLFLADRSRWPGEPSQAA